MSELLNKAINLAVTYHRGQVDKAGEPYILHVLRVGCAGKTEEERVLGFCHDLLEDTTCTPHEIQSLLGLGTLLHLRLLTRSKGEFYNDYIKALSTNPVCVAVKLNDLRDNLDRLPTLALTDAKTAKALNARYLKAYRFLRSL